MTLTWVRRLTLIARCFAILALILIISGIYVLSQNPRISVGEYDIKFILQKGHYRALRIRVADGRMLKDDEYVPVILDRYGNFIRYGVHRRPRITLHDGQFIMCEH